MGTNRRSFQAPAALVAALAGLVLLPAAAQSVYRCTDANGRAVFQQSPCDAAGSGAVAVNGGNVVSGAPAGEAGLRASAERRARVEPAIAQRRVLIGMTEAELRQSLGEPLVVNTTTTAEGVAQQHVYRDRDGSRRTVYTHNGVVTAEHLRPAWASAAARQAPRCDSAAIDDLRFKLGSVTRSQEERRTLRERLAQLERAC